jgi:hypothetical protein
LPTCVARRGSTKTFVTVGGRSSWRRARRTSDEVKDLRDEARQLKGTLADVLIENRLLKKSVLGDGENAS